MQDVETVQVPTVRDALDLAAVAIKRGDIPLGRARLQWVLERAPNNALAWLWMTRCKDTPEKKIQCFYRVLSVDPANRYAIEGLKSLTAPAPAIAGPTNTTPGNARGSPRAAPNVGPEKAPLFPERRSAGQSVWAMIRTRKKRSIAIALVILLACVILIVASLNGFSIGLGGLLVLYLAAQAAPRLLNRQLAHDRKRDRQALRGAEAEEEVEQILDGLREPALVLHDVESPYGNIDHLVISQRQGIFLLETKSHGGRAEVVGGRLYVNDRPPEKDFIAQVLRNTLWLRDEVARVVGEEPWISPLLVFTNAYVPRSNAIKGVMVINKRYLLDAIDQGGRETPLNERIWELRGRIVPPLEPRR